MPAIALSAIAAAGPAHAQADDAAQKLVAAMLGETPLIEDLRSLTDEIGGRPTGSAANMRSVAWALRRFEEAGVRAWRENFTMPDRWLPRSASARVDGHVSFPARVAAMPYSVATPPEGISAPLVDAGFGSAADFAALAERARGAFVLVETAELKDIPGLFAEYNEAVRIERHAFDAGAAGVIYAGSRPRNVLHRHNASRGSKNVHPMLVMERDSALRALRLLRSGAELAIHVTIDVEAGGEYQSYNVIGEIEGTAEPEEIVLIGAHLDSWGIGTGALDNGCNVAMLIDVARQMRRLGLRPRRTVRFGLFNGEEQGLYGSLGYTRIHADELERHVMASSFDIGSGRITGFFTNGRPEMLATVQAALKPVEGLGPFTQLDQPIVGTDNYDFMMQGVANLVANQESANYGPNYHAGTDTFDKVDPRQLKLNSAIAAALAYGFAEAEIDWRRQTRKEIQALIDETDLGDQMRTFGLWEAWVSGERGRSDEER
jgi:hypothetical protein